jgi:SAM-dependent methyltransferase
MDVTALAQLWIGDFLQEGDLAIDATVGNGHDTLFLARRVGAGGRVLGFDIQERALDAARRHLTGEGLNGRVQLIHRSHRAIAETLAEAGEGRAPRAVMFNLGYLPGGDKATTTRAEETLPAVKSALEVLAPGGAMSVVLYPGHPEGEREFAAVSQWAENLSGPVEATFCRPLNRSLKAPCLIAVEKRPSRTF